jgi:hypothetical protein
MKVELPHQSSLRFLINSKDFAILASDQRIPIIVIGDRDGPLEAIIWDFGVDVGLFRQALGVVCHPRTIEGRMPVNRC